MNIRDPVGANGLRPGMIKLIKILFHMLMTLLYNTKPSRGVKEYLFEGQTFVSSFRSKTWGQNEL